MFVVFTSVVEFLIIAMYIVGVPMAEHDSLESVTGPEHGNTAFGGTNDGKI